MLSSKEMSSQVPDTDVKSQSSRHIPCAVHKVVGTFHVPSTWNLGRSLTANGSAERTCTFFGSGSSDFGFFHSFRRVKKLEKDCEASCRSCGRQSTLRASSSKCRFCRCQARIAGFVGARHEWCYCVESQAIGKNSQGCDLWLAQPGWASDSIRLLLACRLVHGLQPWTAFDSQSDGSR